MFTWDSREQDKKEEFTWYGIPLNQMSALAARKSCGRRRARELRTGIRPLGWQHETSARWRSQSYHTFGRREFEGLSPQN